MPKRRQMTDAARFLAKGLDAPAAPVDEVMLSCRCPADLAAQVRLVAVQNRNRGQQPDTVRGVLLDAVRAWLADRKG